MRRFESNVARSHSGLQPQLEYCSFVLLRGLLDVLGYQVTFSGDVVFDVVDDVVALRFLHEARKLLATSIRGGGG